MISEEVINIRKTMNVTVSQSKDDETILIFSLVGFLDSYNSQDFIDTVNDYIDKGFCKIVFECTNMNFISAEGLAALTDINKSLRQNGGDLLLANVQPKVMELFNMLGFTHLFCFAHSDDDFSKMFNETCTSDDDKSFILFPYEVKCPHCKTLLKALKIGKFKCAECKNVFSIDNRGHICFS